MSNEITVSGSLAFTKGSLSDTLSVISGLVTMSGTAFQRGTQSVTTSEAALALGNAGTGGYIIIVNRDPTNFVKVRPGTGALDLIKILPGQFALFQLVASAPYVIADTATCEIEYLLLAA